MSKLPYLEAIGRGETELAVDLLQRLRDQAHGHRATDPRNTVLQRRGDQAQSGLVVNELNRRHCKGLSGT